MLQQIPYLKHLDKGNFFLIAGPCAVESEEITIQIAETLATITDQLQIPFIFKASYRKANRSRLDSFTGIGDENAFSVLEKLRNTYRLPITTDIHLPDEAATVAQFADVLQIPAFLCRQTDLLVAAAQTGKTVNIKKGQFLSPQAMQFAIDKVRQSGNPHVMVTERGTTFGYTDLVVDFRSIPIMQAFEVPVVLDCTHSLQQPNQSVGVTGGLPHLINTIARAGIAAGVNGIFIETHPQPEKAKSDGANMLPLHQIEKLLTQLVQIKRVIA